MSFAPESQVPTASHSNDDDPFGDAIDEGGDADADELDNGEEDRPRFCSLDPPSEVYDKQNVRSRGITTHADFSEACRRGQV